MQQSPAKCPLPAFRAITSHLFSAHPLHCTVYHRLSSTGCQGSTTLSKQQHPPSQMAPSSISAVSNSSSGPHRSPFNESAPCFHNRAPILLPLVLRHPLLTTDRNPVRPAPNILVTCARSVRPPSPPSNSQVLETKLHLCNRPLALSPNTTTLPHPSALSTGCRCFSPLIGTSINTTMPPHS